MPPKSPAPPQLARSLAAETAAESLVNSGEGTIGLPHTWGRAVSFSTKELRSRTKQRSNWLTAKRKQ